MIGSLSSIKRKWSCKWSCLSEAQKIIWNEVLWALLPWWALLASLPQLHRQDYWTDLCWCKQGLNWVGFNGDPPTLPTTISGEFGSYFCRFKSWFVTLGFHSLTYSASFIIYLLMNIMKKNIYISKVMIYLTILVGRQVWPHIIWKLS